MSVITQEDVDLAARMIRTFRASGVEGTRLPRIGEGHSEYMMELVGWFVESLVKKGILKDPK